jgi:hypothetical protein
MSYQVPPIVGVWDERVDSRLVVGFIRLKLPEAALQRG